MRPSSSGKVLDQSSLLMQITEYQKAVKLSLNEVDVVQRRNTGYLRYTPLMKARMPIKTAGSSSLYLKLENLQVTGGFQVRGLLNKILNLPPAQYSRGLVTAIGVGGYGITWSVSVAYVGSLARIPVTVFLDQRTASRTNVQRFTRLGASVRITPSVTAARQKAVALADTEGLLHLSPRADESLMAGAGTMALELLEAAPELRTVVAPVAGGCLSSSMAVVMKQMKRHARVVGVELPRAALLYSPVRAGYLRSAPHGSVAHNPTTNRFRHAFLDDLVKITEEEAREASRFLWHELQITTDLWGASTFAAILAGKVPSLDDRPVCAILSTTGSDGVF